MLAATGVAAAQHVDERAERAAAQARHDAALHVFWADGCAPCDDQRSLITSLLAEDATLRVLAYDVVTSDANAIALERTADHLGVAPGVIPLTLFGARYWVGFDAEVADAIRGATLYAGTHHTPADGSDATSSTLFLSAAQPIALHATEDALYGTLPLRAGANSLLLVLGLGVAALRLKAANAGRVPEPPSEHERRRWRARALSSRREPRVRRR